MGRSPNPSLVNVKRMPLAKVQRPVPQETFLPRADRPSRTVAHKMSQPLVPILVVLAVIVAVTLGWWFGYEAPRRQAAERAALQMQTDAAQQAKAAKEDQECVSREDARAKPVLMLIEQMDATASDADLTRTGETVTAYLNGKPLEKNRLVVEHAWATQQARILAARKQARQGEEILATIATLTDDADDRRLGEVRQVIEAYCALKPTPMNAQRVQNALQTKRQAIEKQRSAVNQIKAVGQAAPAAPAAMGERPTWASNYGTDQYGIWADLTVGKVIQRTCVLRKPRLPK